MGIVGYCSLLFLGMFDALSVLCTPDLDGGFPVHLEAFCLRGIGNFSLPGFILPPTPIPFLV